MMLWLEVLMRLDREQTGITVAQQHLIELALHALRCVGLTGIGDFPFLPPRKSSHASHWMAAPTTTSEI